MEVAKMRAARTDLGRDRCAALIRRTPRSLALRTHSPDLGLVVSRSRIRLQQCRAHEPRSTSQPVCGHTQSLPHELRLMKRIALPTDFSARIARNTQLHLQQETGVCTTRPVDPWGGSYYVERLTHDLAERARAHIAEIEGLGGMVKAIEAGVPKLRIEEAAARTQARIDSGRQAIIGVNRFPPRARRRCPCSRSTTRRCAVPRSSAWRRCGASAIRRRWRARSPR